MHTLIADTEATGLLDAPNLRPLCIQLGDADGTDAVVYTDEPNWNLPPISEALERIATADRVVFHNGINYDYPLIERFYPGALLREQVYDTLVAARLSEPEQRSHSLKTWGERMGVSKGDYTGDFQQFDQAMLDYSIQDVVVGRALYHAVKHVDTWGQSCELEHAVAWAMNAQEANGFGFDLPAAQALDATLRGEVADLSAQLQAAFPPLRRERVFVPKRDNKTLGRTAGFPETTYTDEAFNPASRHHVAERLILAGWQPHEFGADGAATADEKVLSSLPFPEAKLIVKYFKASKKLGMLSDGKNGWLRLASNGRIHGRVVSNGAVTGRMTHRSPNVAQTDGDPRMRSLFVPRKGWTLVGCDMDGVEARVLAHYLQRYDGGAYINTILTGDKALGTDVHSLNRDALRAMGLLVDRDIGKTCLYALIYGAGPYKLGTTIIEGLRALGLTPPRVPPVELGKLVHKALTRSMRGLDRLTSDLHAAVKAKGFITGLDGRHLAVRSPHSILNTLGQSGGAVAMKLAIKLFFEKHGDTHGHTWGLCATVHDEVQIEAHSKGYAELLGADFAECIRLAGEHLKLRIPLAGSYSVGTSWAATH